jgi:hypothetical protein
MMKGMAAFVFISGIWIWPASSVVFAAPIINVNIDENFNQEFALPFPVQDGQVVLCDAGVAANGASCVDDGIGENHGVSDIVTFESRVVTLRSDQPLDPGLNDGGNSPRGDRAGLHLVPAVSTPTFPVIFRDEQMGHEGQTETVGYDPLVGAPGYVGTGLSPSLVG